MSVQGPSSQPFRAYVAATHAAAHKAHAGRAASSAAPAPEAQAPSDSSLWELLTDEERSFFSQQASMGALTYGRARGVAAAAAPAAPIGQRLDVRG